LAERLLSDTTRLQPDALPLVFPPAAFQAKTSSEMLVAEVTTTDLRKTQCQVESKGDIKKTRQG